MADVVKFSLEIIHSLRGETLDTSGLDKASIERLRNPPTSLPDFTSLERHAIDLWIKKDSREKYTDNRDVAVRAHPEDSELLSYYEVQKKIAELTGITPVVHVTCPNTCMAYTGPWKDREECSNPDCRIAASDVTRRSLARTGSAFHARRGAPSHLVRRYRRAGAHPRVRTR